MNSDSECVRMKGVLETVGFSDEGLDCNEDGLKMRGKTREGEVTICLLNLLLKMPARINKGDPREIVEFIEKLQAEKEHAANTLRIFIKDYNYLFTLDTQDMLNKALLEIENG